MIKHWIARLAPAVKIQMILLPALLARGAQVAETPASVCDRDPSTALVFVGTLTESKAMPGHGEYNSLKFHVTEILQGESSQEVSLFKQSEHCDDPTTNPIIGGSYLVRTHVSKGQVEPLWHCQQMRLAEQSSADLAYFRRVQKGDTPTEVSFEARMEPYGYPWKGFSLPGTKAHVSSGERSGTSSLIKTGYIEAHSVRDITRSRSSFQPATSQTPMGDVAFRSLPSSNIFVPRWHCAPGPVHPSRRLWWVKMALGSLCCPTFNSVW